MPSPARNRLVCRRVKEPMALRDWQEGDLGLLQASLGDPAMTRYLGGPETPEQIAARHRRYLALAGTGTGRMLVILVGIGHESAGTVGYWDKDWLNEQVYEMGWSVLRAYQGRGIATRATVLALEHARRDGRHRYVHAFPSVQNVASNATCRKAAFALMGEYDFEYPKGHLMQCNDWRFDLEA